MSESQFYCHPACLQRAYWRRVFVEVEAEIRGLRPGQLIELILAVEEAEAETWWQDRPATRTGRRVAVELSLRGWPDDVIDSTLGFPHGATAQVVAGALHPKGKQVVAAHLEGDSPSRISRDLGVGIATVLRILEGIGEEPHRARDLVKSGDHNRAIQRRYEEGWSYARIAEHLGISETKVKSRIQYLRKKGRIALPPRSRAHSGPRLQVGGSTPSQHDPTNDPDPDNSAV